MFAPGTDRRPGFDAVIGNPPYDNSRGGLKDNPELSALAAYARQCGHYRIRGAVDLYRLFLQRAVQLCRPGGVVSMIVPRSLLGDRDSAPERKMLLDECELLSIDEFPFDDSVRRVFSSAALATCIVTCRTGGPTRSFAMARWPDGRMSRAPSRTIQRRDALERFWPEDAPIVNWSENEWSAMDHLASAPWICPLSEFSIAAIGEANSGYHKDFMVDDDTGALLVRGTDVAPYLIRTGGSRKRWIDVAGFLGSLTPFVRDRLRVDESRVAKQAVKNINGRKRLVAALTRPGWFLADSTDYFIAEAPYDSRYLLALLNSRTVPEWLFGRMSTNNNVNLYQVRNLPVPRICFEGDAGTRAERAAEGRRLVEEWIRHRESTHGSGPAPSCSRHEKSRRPADRDLNDWIALAASANGSAGVPACVHDVIVRLAQEIIDLKREDLRQPLDFARRSQTDHRIRIVEDLIDSMIWRMYGLSPSGSVETERPRRLDNGRSR